jgi:hypothetical protein
MNIPKSLLNRIAKLEQRHLPDPVSKEVLIDELTAELDLVAARLRASPDWREPTLEECERIAREFDAFMATLGWRSSLFENM